MKTVNQEELVKKARGYQPETIIEKIGLPGIETLHERGIEEVADTLANVIKSRANVVSVKFTVGKAIELEVRNPALR